MILVTGATGLLGRHLVPTLLDAGWDVRCLVRDTNRARALLGEEPEFCSGDVTVPDKLSKACRGAEIVVHLVAVIREQGKVTYERVNVQGTLNIVQAAEAAGCRRFIHLSVLGVQDAPAYRYVYSKWLGEQVVKKSSLEWIIFRPSLLYGKGFGFFDRMEQSLKFNIPPFAVVPAARTRFQPLAAQDLASCIATAVRNHDSVKEVYELGGPEYLNYAEMLDIWLKVKGWKRIKLLIPLPLLRPIVSLMEHLMADPPVTSVEFKQLEVDNITDLKSVKKAFGFCPRSLKEGLAELEISH